MPSIHLHRHSERRRRRLAVPALLAVIVLTAAACGTRQTRAAVLAAERGGAVASVQASRTSNVDQAVAGDSGSAAAVDTAGAAATSGPQASTGGGTKGGATSASSTSGAATGTATTAGCTTQGTPVIVGQVGAFSGLVGANVQGAIQTLFAWARDVNAQGGLACHPITIAQRDTGSDPAKAKAVVEELVRDKGAVAIVGSQVPLDTAGFRSGVEEEQVAAIGGDQVTPSWRESPFMFPVGGTDKAGFAGSIRNAARAGGTKLAILYCVESTACQSFHDTAIEYAPKFNVKVVYESSVSLTQPDFTSQCQNAKNAGADMLVFAGDAAGLARTARSCASLQYFPKYPIAATQGSFDKQDPNLRKAGVFLASLTFPAMLSDTAAQKRFQAAMSRYAPSSPMDAAASQTWSSGEMLRAAVDALGPSARSAPLTKALVLQGLDKIKGETLDGLIPPTTYHVGQAQAQNLCFYSLGFSSDGVISALNGGKYECF